jgi:hypothetical protein
MLSRFRFQIYEEAVILAPEWSKDGFATVRFPSPARPSFKPREPFCTTSQHHLRLVGPVDMWLIADSG